MKAYQSRIMPGLFGAALAIYAAGAVQAQAVNGNYLGSGNTVTVSQGIQNFANRYGEIVIVHGALNANAPISNAFAGSLTSNDAIAALAQAAGAQVTKVYFVTPASSKSAVTAGVSASKIVSNDVSVRVRSNGVSAADAIRSIASQSNAEVRFPDGPPTGMVSLPTSWISLDKAISTAALQTRTHWSVGYILRSTNPLLAAMPTPSSAPLEAFSPGTTGDSSAAIASEPSPATSGDSAAAAPDTTARRTNVAAAVPAGGEPSVYGVQNGVIIKLPAEPPLPRDSKGNILPITVHITPQVPVVATAADTGSTASRSSRRYYPSANNFNSGWAADSPGVDNLTSDGSVQVIDPNAGGGTSASGLGFVPNNVAFGPGGYGGFGSGFTSNSPSFYNY